MHAWSFTYTHKSEEHRKENLEKRNYWKEQKSEERKRFKTKARKVGEFKKGHNKEMMECSLKNMYVRICFDDAHKVFDEMS